MQSSSIKGSFLKHTISERKARTKKLIVLKLFMIISIQSIDELSGEYPKHFNSTVKIFLYKLKTLILEQPYYLRGKAVNPIMELNFLFYRTF